MNATQLAQTAYAPASPVSQGPRDVEYKAFARVTAALRAARGGPVKNMAQALHDNVRLWSTLAADVASPQNALPAPLKAQIINLAAFASVHAGRVLSGSEDVEALIDVNTAIMRGLRPSPTGAT